MQNKNMREEALRYHAEGQPGKIASEEATPSEKTVITPVTSDFEKEQKIEETTETQEISEEKKNRVSRGVILAIILIACIAGGIYWYLQSDKTSDLQSPATIKNTQEQLEEDIPAIPVNDSLMQGKDTANIWTNVAGKETISQSQQTVSPSTEKSSGVATTANVAKETLADTVEYDITGTKTNYTLQEGESLVKLAVKFYGTKKLWPYIVKHNKNIIKDADRVPIGTTLRIPELTPKSKKKNPTLKSVILEKPTLSSLLKTNPVPDLSGSGARLFSSVPPTLLISTSILPYSFIEKSINSLQL